MDVDKIFSPGKWFVIFCALFILVWLGLQYVANMRLQEVGKLYANEVYTWSWTEDPNRKWASSAEITDVSVVEKKPNDAIVKVKGKQHISLTSGDGPGQSEVVDCGATLNFYRRNNQWELGRVEYQ